MSKKWMSAGLAALFMAVTLAGCKDDGAPAVKTGGSRPIGDISHLDLQYSVTINDIAVRTAIGRELKVTVQAYCQNEAGRHKTIEAYTQACRGVIAEKLLYGARLEDGMSRFESYPPMGSREIRPYNYFDEAMMLRALPVNYRHDLYTVTDVRDCATDMRTPTMTPDRAPPEGGWPSAEERRKLQVHKAVHGRVVDGVCRFNP